jgi:hypothetical protein
MKTFTLPLVVAVAIGAITVGSASAMPFSTNGSAGLNESLVQDVRVVCDRRGNCWNNNRRYRSARRYYSPGYYDRPAYYASPSYGYYGGPRVGIGIGPFGFGMY